MPARTAALLAALLLPAAASAGDWRLWPRYPAAHPECRMERAGCPNTVAPWARHTYDGTYKGYHVGGSQACGGERRCFTEGTWGVDYAPWYSRVALRWRHGHDATGYYGQYEPDGKVCPVPELAD